MLKDGKFLREAPLRIGAYYVPRSNTTRFTPEEQFMQNLLLGVEAEQQSLIDKILRLVLRT